jgi:hypothetical protein
VTLRRKRTTRRGAVIRVVTTNFLFLCFFVVSLPVQAILFFHLMYKKQITAKTLVFPLITALGILENTAKSAPFYVFLVLYLVNLVLLIVWLVIVV